VVFRYHLLQPSNWILREVLFHKSPRNRLTCLRHGWRQLNTWRGLVCCQKEFEEKSSGIQISSSTAEQLETVLTHSGVGTDASEFNLPAVAESVARTVLGDTFDLQEVNSGDDAEILSRVENLLLMYGGRKCY
jgi:hypothetical protein